MAMKKGNTAAMPMDDYQARDDMHTLSRAHEITNDKKRHAAARAHAASELEKMRAISSPMDGPTVEGKEKGKPDAEDRAEMKGKKK